MSGNGQICFPDGLFDFRTVRSFPDTWQPYPHLLQCFFLFVLIFHRHHNRLVGLYPGAPSMSGPTFSGDCRRHGLVRHSCHTSLTLTQPTIDQRQCDQLRIGLATRVVTGGHAPIQPRQRASWDSHRFEQFFGERWGGISRLVRPRSSPRHQVQEQDQDTKNTHRDSLETKICLETSRPCGLEA